MIVVAPEELKGMLRPHARLLGLDIGTKTVGLALSDTRRTIATPLETIRRGRFTEDAQRLLRLVREHDVGGLVLGLPVSLDGSEGPRCQSVRQFARNLQQLAAQAGEPSEQGGPPILFWDERFSTVVVERQMIEADLSRRRRAELVDKAAAAYILQGLLDRLANIGAGAQFGRFRGTASDRE